MLKNYERDGLAHKFALRAALIAASSNKEIKDFYEYFEKVYRIRSKILHAKSIGELEMDKIDVTVVMHPYSFSGPVTRLRFDAITLSKRILSRLLKLLFVKSNLKSFDELIDFVDAAVLDPNLREEIFKIE